MISREAEKDIIQLLEQFPALALVGPRQVGKTTLAKLLAKKIDKEVVYVDLENPRDDNKLRDAILFFENHREHCVIIDEIQRRKELFPILRSSIDENRVPARFILLGSASPELIRDTSESLAGRIYYKELFPFNLSEIHEQYSVENHWLKGGFPGSILTDSLAKSLRWRAAYIQSYIERDLPLLGFSMGSSDAQRLLKMLAHLQAQFLNLNTLSLSLGISVPSVKKYIQLLQQAFILRLLEPYFVNSGKRLVKSPKIYIRDSGLLNYLNNIDSYDELLAHPSIGHFWEGYVIEQLLSVLPEKYQCYFYRTQQGAELDLVIVKGIKAVLGLEIKFSTQPALSKGNFIAMEDLELKKCYVVIPGNNKSDSYFLKNNIEVIHLPGLIDRIKTLP